MKRRRTRSPQKKINQKTKKNLNTLDRWILKKQSCDSKTSDNNSNSDEQRTTERFESDFLKYGVSLPSIQDAISYKRKLEEMKEAVSNLDFGDDTVEIISLSVDESKPQILDCKHLTDEELEYQLERNYQYLYDIINGLSRSERHIKFQKENYNYNCTTEDLKYNTSMITFTFEQKELLLSYLFEKFDQSDYGNKIQYFFKVLLPELCTKIFMDTHNMTYSEAVSYLDGRPVE